MTDNNDQIRLESDPAFPQSIQKAVDGYGNLYGIVLKKRLDGEFCQRRRGKPGKADNAGIQEYLLRLYVETRFTPEYLFLSEQDYRALCHEVARLMGSTADWSDRFDGRGRIVKIASPATGDYIHLATLPDLQEGEVMVLYEYK